MYRATRVAHDGLRRPIAGNPMSDEQYGSTPEGAGYGLLGGRLFREPAPGLPPQVVLGHVLVLLRRYAEAVGGGRAPLEIDAHLDAANTPVPDVSFVRADNPRRLDRRGIHGCAPDLGVEVLSPRAAARDRGAKAELYAGHGCREYWLGDPDAPRLEMRRAVAPGRVDTMGVLSVGEALESAGLPGLRVDVGEVFAGA